MKTYFGSALLCLLLLSSWQVTAQSSNKPKLKFGGQLYLSTYYDSYKSVESHDGISYSFPMAPDFDPNGSDLNKSGHLGMSAHQTRLNFTASDFKLLDADARVYIETDFMGSKSDYIGTLQVRHAYLDLRWEKNELLFGQTINVQQLDEVTSGLLTTGSGAPIAIQVRPAMIRYGRDLGKSWKTYTAVSYHKTKTRHPENPEAEKANRYSSLPSVEARIQYGSVDKVFFGISGGYKVLRPRTITDKGFKASKKIRSGSASAFLRWNINGHTFKTQTFYGSDMSHLGMIGGYGKKLDDNSDDYGYTNFRTVTSWGDFETKPYNNFRFGIFGGYLENLGTGKAVDPNMLYTWIGELHSTGRLSPRITHTKDNLMLGFEYSYFWAKWGMLFDEKYVATKSYKTTMNNRALFVVRYTF